MMRLGVDGPGVGGTLNTSQPTKTTEPKMNANELTLFEMTERKLVATWMSHDGTLVLLWANGFGEWAQTIRALVA